MLGLSIGLPHSLALARAVRSATETIRQELFGQGQQGVFYIPQPIVEGTQVLFEDSAGTIPIPLGADNTPVGLMRDLSGNGNDAFQTTSADRPIYRTNGSLHWLSLNGANQRMETPLVLDPDKAVGAVRVKRTGSGDGYIFGSNATPYSGQWLASGGASAQNVLLRGAASVVTTGMGWVSSAWAADITGGSGIVIDSQGATSAASFSSAVKPTATFRIGMRPGSTATFAMEIAGLIQVFDNDSESDAQTLHDYVSGL